MNYAWFDVSHATAGIFRSDGYKKKTKDLNPKNKKRGTGN